MTAAATTNELLTKILAQLTEINEKLLPQAYCPHGDPGVCMSCIRDMQIGWDIGQAMKR